MKQFIISGVLVTTWFGFLRASINNPNFTNSNTRVIGADTFSNNVLASIASFIRLAENPKNNTVFFMSELKQTSRWGQPEYAGPFPLPGFKATIRKISTYRKGGITEWEWEARLMEAPRNQKTEQLKTLKKQVDSLLHFFDKHVDNSFKHDRVTYMSVYSNQSDSYWPTEYADIIIRFNKASHNTEQQAYGSLLTLYKPLLLQPATAEECTRKLAGAFKVEEIPEDRQRDFFISYIRTVAEKNITAAYGVLLETPQFIKLEDLMAQFTENQKVEIRKITRAVLYEFYGKQNNDAEAVAMQQKKMQTQNQTSKCDKINQTDDASKYRVGLTVSGTYKNAQFIGRVTSVDCANGKITITEPGVLPAGRGRTAMIGFEDFIFWDKHYYQFYRCSRCGGEGGETIVTTQTRTKELPFGYFEGIRTTSTRTTTKTKWESCYKCAGTGLALEKDRDPWNNGK